MEAGMHGQGIRIPDPIEFKQATAQGNKRKQGQGDKEKNPLDSVMKRDAADHSDRTFTVELILADNHLVNGTVHIAISVKTDRAKDGFIGSGEQGLF
jgi:hypothetical protein